MGRGELGPSTPMCDGGFIDTRHPSRILNYVSLLYIARNNRIRTYIFTSGHFPSDRIRSPTSNSTLQVVDSNLLPSLSHSPFCLRIFSCLPASCSCAQGCGYTASPVRCSPDTLPNPPHLGCSYAASAARCSPGRAGYHSITYLLSTTPYPRHHAASLRALLM